MVRKSILAVLLICVSTFLVAGTVSRTAKDAGGTAFVDNTLIQAAELNEDFDTLYTLVNGQLDNDNIVAAAGIAYSKLTLTGSVVNADITASANIPFTKMLQDANQLDADIVDDYSTDEAEQATTSSPGTSDSATLATNLETEIAQLRNIIERSTVGTNASAVVGAAASAALASWVDGGSLGPNMIYNGGFDVLSTLATGSNGDGWTLVLTPTLAAANLTESEGEGDGQGISMTGAGAALEGLAQSLNGLKAGTRYLVLAAVRPTTGDSCRLRTTGADTAGSQLSVDSVADNAFETIGGIFVTDATPGNVGIELVSVADLDVCVWDHVGVYEISDGPVTHYSTVAVYDVDTDAGNDLGTAGADPDWVDNPNLSVTFTPPSPGWVVEVGYSVSMYDPTSASGAQVQCRLEEGGAAVNGTETGSSGQSAVTGDPAHYSFSSKFIKINPVAGDALTWTVACNETSTAILLWNASGGGDDDSSSLYLIAHPPG